MAAAPTLFINSLFLSLITLHAFTFPTHSQALRPAASAPSPPASSLVLSLTLSKTSLPSPKKPYKPITPTQSLDMVEPLRGIRDGYLIPLNLGTPPQPVQVYMDTGSDLTWAPCGNLTFACIDCDVGGPKTFGNFSPSLSSTASRDLCGSRFCSDVHSSDNSLDPCTISGCSLPTLLNSICPRPCPSFAYTYGAGGAVTGTLTRDTLHVHVSNATTRDVPKFCFGCVGATYREPIGIAGFGRGPLSLPSQLGFGKKGFSHCFLPFKYANTPNSSSVLLVGEASLSYREGMQFTPMLNSPMYPNYYYVGLEAVTVGTTTTSVTTSLKEFDSQGNGGMLIDSGTTYTHLPEPFYSDLVSTLGSAIGYPRAADVETKTGFDLCYRVPAAAGVVGFPEVTFRFLSNVSVVVGEENMFYAVAAASNGTVVKCMLMQSMEEEGEEGPAGVFGSFQQQNVEVVYDLGNQRIGFRGMDCASAAASRGLVGQK